MATVNEVVAWAKGLADQGQGVDFDGVYGKQCVDLPNWILGKFFSKSIWGNAIDLLTSAKQVGYQVIYDAPGVNPKMGDLFVVKSYGHPYGHTGLVIADSDGYTIKTIEQNVDGYRDDNRDGINDQFQFGGPARYVTRKFDQADGKVIGWIRPPYGSLTIPQNTPVGLKKIKDEKGVMTVKVAAVNVRDTAS
ncbi:TPA: CHAP domain-containing protein, partial [Streptococcus suis]